MPEVPGFVPRIVVELYERINSQNAAQLRTVDLRNDILLATRDHPEARQRKPFLFGKAARYIGREVVVPPSGTDYAIMYDGINGPYRYRGIEIGLQAAPESLIIWGNDGIVVCNSRDSRYELTSVIGQPIKIYGQRFDGRYYKALRLAEEEDIEKYRELYAYILNPEIAAPYIELTWNGGIRRASR